MHIGVHLSNLQGDDNIHSDDRACVMVRTFGDAEATIARRRHDLFTMMVETSFAIQLDSVQALCGCWVLTELYMLKEISWRGGVRKFTARCQTT